MPTSATPKSAGAEGPPVPPTYPVTPDVIQRFVMIAGYGTKGAPLTVVAPLAEGFYEWTIQDLLAALFNQNPGMSDEQFYRLLASLRFLFREYPNDGTTDEGRAINAAIVRAVNFIASVILTDPKTGPDWEFNGLTASPIPGPRPSDKVWEVAFRFVNVGNALLAPIVVKAQMDVSDVLPTMIGVYQSQGRGA